MEMREETKHWTLPPCLRQTVRTMAAKPVSRLFRTQSAAVYRQRLQDVIDAPRVRFITAQIYSGPPHGDVAIMCHRDGDLPLPSADLREHTIALSWNADSSNWPTIEFVGNFRRLSIRGHSNNLDVDDPISALRSAT